MLLIRWVTRGLQWLVQWDATPKGKANPQNQSQFRLRTATRPHEAEISSSRLSSDLFTIVIVRGVNSSDEYVPAPCTHCPSSQPSEFLVSCWFLPVSSQSFARWANLDNI